MHDTSYEAKIMPPKLYLLIMTKLNQIVKVSKFNINLISNDKKGI